MERETGAIRTSTPGIVRQCLVPIVARALVFLIVGPLVLMLFGKYAGAVQDKVFDYRGDASIAGRIFVFVLYSAAEIGAIVAAIAATNFMDGKAMFRPLRGRSGTVATGQKILLISLVIQLFILPVWQSAYFNSFGAIAFAIYLLTFGFGFSMWRQVLWICLGLLPTFSIWLFAVIDVRGSDANLLLTMFLPVGLVLFQLVIILMLSRRASHSLRAAGVTVKFFGVPFSEIPALLDPNAPELPARNVDELSPGQAADNESLKEESVLDPPFYYVGPTNEPIGPITASVLLQMRESGTVTDETMVAPEGESEWKPLSAYLQRVDDSESQP